MMGLRFLRARIITTDAALNNFQITGLCKGYRHDFSRTGENKDESE
jgi:hypothetical protein